MVESVCVLRSGVVCVPMSGVVCVLLAGGMGVSMIPMSDEVMAGAPCTVQYSPAGSS